MGVASCGVLFISRSTKCCKVAEVSIFGADAFQSAVTPMGDQEIRLARPESTLVLISNANITFFTNFKTQFQTSIMAISVQFNAEISKYPMSLLIRSRFLHQERR
jgi:hypothetical protein